MKVGVAKETAAGERRVALVPEALGKLTAAGLEVLVEAGAGAGAAIPDQAYVEAGATVVSTVDRAMSARGKARRDPDGSRRCRTATPRRPRARVTLGILHPVPPDGTSLRHRTRSRWCP